MEENNGRDQEAGVEEDQVAGRDEEQKVEQDAVNTEIDAIANEANAQETNKNEKESKEETENNMALGMCLGAAFGVVFGPMLFHDMGTGIAICLPLGMLIGMGIKSGKKKD